MVRRDNTEICVEVVRKLAPAWETPLCFHGCTKSLRPNQLIPALEQSDDAHMLHRQSSIAERVVQCQDCLENFHTLPYKLFPCSRYRPPLRYFPDPPSAEEQARSWLARHDRKLKPGKALRDGDGFEHTLKPTPPPQYDLSRVVKLRG